MVENVTRLAERRGDNRHPVDVLAEAREQIKKWKEVEDEARQKILDGECSLTGEEYTATLKRRKFDRPDAEAMWKVLPPELLAKCMKAVTFNMVQLKKRIDTRRI